MLSSSNLPKSSHLKKKSPMIYKSPAPNLTHEIFVSTPFSKYIKLVHTLVRDQ